MRAITKMNQENTKNKMNSIDGYSHVHAKQIDI